MEFEDMWRNLNGEGNYLDYKLTLRNESMGSKQD